MTSKVLICEKCFESIALKKPNYAKVWYDICVAASWDRRLPRPREKIARMHFDKAVEYLENRNFVVSCEIAKDDYIVKMLGFMSIENLETGCITDTFCIDENHLDELEDSV